MEPDLRDVPAKRLARELALRAPRMIRKRLRGQQASLSPGATEPDRTPFATLERSGLAPVELWSGYRNSIKGRWPKFFWPVRVLLDLDERVSLRPALRQLADDLMSARTLPAPLGEIVDLLESEVCRFPEHVRRADFTVGGIDRPVFAAIPSGEEVSRIRKSYLASATGILSRLCEFGFKGEGSRALEIGCGRGYMTFALATLGIAEAIGLDTRRRTYYSLAEEGLVREAFSIGSGKNAVAAVLQEGDAMNIPLPDESFDLVHSTSVLEHISDSHLVLSGKCTGC